MSALWNALKGLQARIRGVPAADMAILADGAQQPAEAPGNSFSTLRADPLNSSPMTLDIKNVSGADHSLENICTCTTKSHFGKSRDEIDREVDAMWNMTEKTVRPSLARRRQWL